MTGQSEHPVQHLPPEVFRAELEELDARRKAAGLKGLPESPTEATGPSVKKGLVGLAISGGGIRSSTFSLGVIQSLVRGGVFKAFDYVSTVSGGGYTGSMLSSLLGERRPPEEPFPLAKEPGQVEPLGLRHLRNGSNYLSPGGLLDKLRLLLQVIRGLLLSAVLLIPWHLLATGVMAMGYVLTHDPKTKALEGVINPFVLAVPLVGMILLSPLMLRCFRKQLGWNARNFLSRTMAALLGLVLLAVVLVSLNTLLDKVVELPGLLDDGAALEKGWHLATWGLVALAALALLLLSARARAHLRRPALAAVSLVGPAALLVGGVLFFLYIVPIPILPLQFKHQLPSSAGLGAPLSAALEWRLGEMSRPCVFMSKQEPSWIIYNHTGSDEAPCQSLPEGGVQGSTDSDEHRHWTATYRIVEKDHRLQVLGLGDGDPWRDGFHKAFGLIVLAIFLLLLLLIVDVNSTSLHQFYRDRLSRLYLFRLHQGRVVATDDLRLSELNGPGSTAPYHLLNVTLNLHGEGSKCSWLRGRKSDFFIFSKRYCGGPRTGYCPTSEMEKADPRIDLGTAMAISGAAASPNMGSMKLESVRFLMALLNIRLGYWAPNPERLTRSGAVRRLLNRLRLLAGPGSPFLLRETLGAMDASGPYVNLSDGGHLENLGVYELLRRRCKVVVAIDGEADPQMKFSSLHALMRYAWIDLGVRIRLKEQELEQLRPPDAGTSSLHYAIGSIDYGGGEEGTFVYIKSSVTGDEDPIVAHYRAEHRAFPHESTADQFFDEHQFESYRELGEHIGRELLEEEAFQALFAVKPDALAPAEAPAAGLLPVAAYVAPPALVQRPGGSRPEA